MLLGLRLIDWLVMLATLAGIIGYGLYRSRGSATTSQYLLAGKTMPWYAMALSIMATQASAVTFISTTSQGYVDGLRFVQFYFGLPLAMILISLTAVPRFHRAGVYTAYEYLEKRFDAKTRALVSFIFLLSRGLAVGMALYAPSIVLSVILGWPEQWTIVIMGFVAVVFVTLGGIKAVTWTDTQQMVIVTIGLLSSFFTALYLLPSDVSFAGALKLAAAAGRLNPVTTNFDWNDRYNLFSGVIGGMFLALAYFGTDQSQVQRYLTGRSITQSRLSLLFNAVAKIPMQFFILLTGVMVFVFYIFTMPPALFDKSAMARATAHAEYAPAQANFESAVRARENAARTYLAQGTQDTAATFVKAQNEVNKTKAEVAKLAGAKVNDTNHIFLSFVTAYLPAGLVGLLMAVIFGAALSVISGEINSLATVTVIDVYKRFIADEDLADHRLLRVSRLATFFWGAYAVASANFVSNLKGTLIELMNLIGSLFYGGMLGVFILAFYFPKVRSTPAFIGVLVGEAVIFACYWFTGIAFLWYNVIGCVVVLATALAINAATPATAE